MDATIQDLTEGISSLLKLTLENNTQALSGNQHVEVDRMIDEKTEPIKEDIKKIEDNHMDMKICLTEITSISSFLKWGIPIALTGGIALGSAIAKLA